MKDDIDDWLDGLAGRRSVDDPMDRALARLLRDASQSPVDELGRQRLFRRLEQEGLLTTATAPTRRAISNLTSRRGAYTALHMQIQKKAHKNE